MKRLMFYVAVALMFGQFKVDAQEAETSEPQVWIEVNGQTQGYFQPPRLSLVLLQAAKDKSLYWPGARLYRLDQLPAELLQQQQQVLEHLRLLTIHWQEQPRLAQAMMQMRSQIKSWRFGQPIAARLEGDLVQQRGFLNPRLDPGRYLLHAQKRRAVVQLFSLLGEQFEMHQQHKLVYEYVTPILGSGLSDADVALLLRHAEAPIEVPVADWNRERRPLRPDDLVFIAVSEDWLTPETSDLNQRIVFLLQHRIYP